MNDVAALRERVEKILPSVMDDFVSFVAIPSVSSQPEHADDVDAAAQRVVQHVRDLGCEDVKVVSSGGKPAVIARFHVDDDAPTVCLYAHMDVQPTGDVSLWSSQPFEAEKRGDRLYGRGTADDKAGVWCHLATLRAFDGKPPVNVTLLIEGEEEIGSPTLAQILAENTGDLTADVYVIADCGNWAEGKPAFTTSLRGVVDGTIEVRTLDHAVHSGEYGGVVPDALTTLCRLIATLHDEDGNVAVAGLVSEDGPDLDYTEERLRNESSLLDGVDILGTGPLASRTWGKPSISVVGLDTTTIADSTPTIIPSARARVSLRVAPGDTAENAFACLKKHLEENVDWGAHVTVTGGEAAQPSSLTFSGPYAEAAKAAWTDAFGVEPVLIGTGGSIGMIAEFQQEFPEATVLATAVSDPDCRMHGIDESLFLPDWENVIVAQMRFLTDLAR